MCGNQDLVVMPVTPSTVNRDLRALIVKTGVPAGTMHGLWHGSATIMLRVGVFSALVALKLGHADIGTTVDRNGHLAVAVLAVASAPPWNWHAGQWHRRLTSTETTPCRRID